MLRFQELKEKGWVNLSSEERSEYQDLKQGSMEDTGYKGSTPVADVSEKEITISEKKLREMIASEVETLKAENLVLKQKQKELHNEMGMGEWNEEQQLKDRTHHSWLKLYREDADQEHGLVVYWGLHKIVRDDRGYIKDQLYKIKCLYPDGDEKEYIIPLLVLAQMSDREKVKIIKQEKTKLVKVHGKVRKSAKDKEGYTRSVNIVDGGVEEGEGGDWTELREVREQNIVTIERQTGQTYKMEDKYLNS